MISSALQPPQGKPQAGRWHAGALCSLTLNQTNQSSEITAGHIRPFASDLDVWDAWPLSDPFGVPVAWRDGELWFALAVSRADDPEERHHLARIHHFYRKDDSFEHIGQTLPEEISPGARQWSGSARLEKGIVTLFFTATGHKGDTKLSYRQRLFKTQAKMGLNGLFEKWSVPTEFIHADGHIYRPANENEGEPGKIKAFRDPAHFRTGDDESYIVFTASSAAKPSAHDGLIGAAIRVGRGDYKLLPPLIDATGLSNELERPHIVDHGGQLYLFWSTQRGVFVPNVDAPTGLYGATAKSMEGPWALLNGHGLVIANPRHRPTQAYSWWVLPDLSVTSFVDYWGPEDASTPEEVSRRARFGGNFAPFIRIALDGAATRILRE